MGLFGIVSDHGDRGYNEFCAGDGRFRNAGCNEPGGGDGRFSNSGCIRAHFIDFDQTNCAGQDEVLSLQDDAKTDALLQEVHLKTTTNNMESYVEGHTLRMINKH